VENIEESNRKIRKDIGEEINEALYSLTLPHKLMGGTSCSLSSASDHHHEPFFFFLFSFFGVCWPEFANCTEKAKNKYNYGPIEIKDRFGF
jgi:hypothetical protein